MRYDHFTSYYYEVHHFSVGNAGCTTINSRPFFKFMKKHTFRKWRIQISGGYNFYIGEYMSIDTNAYLFAADIVWCVRVSILLIKGCSVLHKLRVRCDAQVELSSLFPIAVSCLLLKGPGEGVIYLQISEMLSFLLGKGGSTSTLDCVYHCK